MEFEYKEEYTLATCICLNITDSCNLACTYCFVQQKPHYMTLNIAKQSVDYVVKNLLKKEELNILDTPDETATITFFGGEPTLLWDEIIVPTVEYAEAIYPKLVKFNMTTNGTLLDKEKIEFLSSHNIPILLSMDGNKAIQDINRPCRNGDSSFDLVEPNIQYILNYLPFTTFRATINQNNCSTLFEDTYLYAISKGFKNIFLCPNAREEWTEENLNILHNEINKIWTYIILSFLNNEEPIHQSMVDGIFIDILRLDLQTFYKEKEILNPNRTIYRCGLGVTSLSINYKGDLFACQEQDSRDTNDYFYIGDIFNGINKEKHSKILSDYFKNEIIQNSNENMCLVCPVRQVCLEETCPSVSKDIFNNFFIRPTVDCKIQQWFFENAITAMNILVKENNITFKNYLERLYEDFKNKKAVK